MATRQASRRWKGMGLSPHMYPEWARTDAVRLAPGTYVAGTIVGQISTLTAQNDVQTITVSGTPTGGTFRLAFNGQVTGPINYNAAAADVQAALEALSNVGTGNVACTGGPFPGSTVVCTFQADMASIEQPLMTLYSNSLTGGATPSASVAHTTPGRASGGHWKAYNDANSDGSDTAKAILQYDTTVDTYGNHTCGGGEHGETTKSAPVYISGYFRTADLTGLDANGVADLGKIVEGSVGALTNTATVLRLPA